MGVLSFQSKEFYCGIQGLPHASEIRSMGRCDLLPGLWLTAGGFSQTMRDWLGLPASLLTGTGEFLLLYGAVVAFALE